RGHEDSVRQPPSARAIRRTPTCSVQLLPGAGPRPCAGRVGLACGGLRTRRRSRIDRPAVVSDISSRDRLCGVPKASYRPQRSPPSAGAASSSLGDAETTRKYILDGGHEMANRTKPTLEKRAKER